MNETDVLRFWFNEIDPGYWFQADEDVDHEIRKRFGLLHNAVVHGECAFWRLTIRGRLAEIIVIDQFSRNLFRNSGPAYAFDGMALVLTQEAIATGQQIELNIQERTFLYMPMMHSESLLIHDMALKYFSEPGLEEALAYERKHRQILERFHRYPHRNTELGRASSLEEIVFLQEEDALF